MNSLNKILVFGFVSLSASFLKASEGVKCIGPGKIFVAVQNHAENLADNSKTIIWLKFFKDSNDKLTLADYAKGNRGNIALVKGAKKSFCINSKYKKIKWSLGSLHGSTDTKVNSIFGKIFDSKWFQYITLKDGDFIHLYPQAKDPKKKYLISHSKEDRISLRKTKQIYSDFKDYVEVK